MENGEAGEPHDLLRVGAKNFHVPCWPRSPAPLQAALQVTEGKCGSLWLMVLSRFFHMVVEKLRLVPRSGFFLGERWLKSLIWIVSLRKPAGAPSFYLQ